MNNCWLLLTMYGIVMVVAVHARSIIGSSDDDNNDVKKDATLSQEIDDALYDENDSLERHYLKPNNHHLHEPLQDRFDRFAAYLTHPNVGILFRPYEFLVKLQRTGAAWLSNFNDAVFGYGQVGGGHDYPFPYRSVNNVNNNNATTRNHTSTN